MVYIVYYHPMVCVVFAVMVNCVAELIIYIIQPEACAVAVISHTPCVWYLNKQALMTCRWALINWAKLLFSCMAAWSWSHRADRCRPGGRSWWRTVINTSPAWCWTPRVVRVSVLVLIKSCHLFVCAVSCLNNVTVYHHHHHHQHVRFMLSLSACVIPLLQQLSCVSGLYIVSWMSLFENVSQKEAFQCFQYYTCMSYCDKAKLVY